MPIGTDLSPSAHSKVSSMLDTPFRIYRELYIRIIASVSKSSRTICSVLAVYLLTGDRNAAPELARFIATTRSTVRMLYPVA